MLKKILKEAVGIVVGKQTEDIVDLLDSKKYINEFIIAKKMGITINQTRNILYKLSDNGLVSSVRKKDKKKGWYTYFWRIEVLKSLEFLKNILKKKIEQIGNQIKSRETKQFYVCEKCNIEFNEENALLHNFTCSECGNIFNMKDNSRVLRELKRGREKTEQEIGLISEELKEEKCKLDKIKEKEQKKIEMEKITLRKKKREQQKKINKKEEKKKISKKIFKKSKKKISKKEHHKISKAKKIKKKARKK